MNVIPTKHGHAKHCYSDFVSPLYIITAAYQIYWKLDTIHATSFFITILRPYLPCCARELSISRIARKLVIAAGWMEPWLDVQSCIADKVLSNFLPNVTTCSLLNYLFDHLFERCWIHTNLAIAAGDRWNGAFMKWAWACVPTDNLVAIASTHWMLYQYDCSQFRCYC